VHRCTSELYGFRQRRARWAQKLKSLTQRKTFEVVEHLRRQGCGETQLQIESLRSSVKLCQVGIEQCKECTEKNYAMSSLEARII
jgi:hypothetical protein